MIGRFQSVCVFLSVLEGSFLVVVTMLDDSEKYNRVFSF